MGCCLEWLKCWILNPKNVGIQLDHRILATTTLVSITGMWVATRKLPVDSPDTCFVECYPWHGCSSGKELTHYACSLSAVPICSEAVFTARFVAFAVV